MRRKPYTAIGISRVPCVRCGAPSSQQFQICADKNQYRGLCMQCDIKLNTFIMRFLFGRSKETEIKLYKKRMLEMYND